MAQATLSFSTHEKPVVEFKPGEINSWKGRRLVIKAQHAHGSGRIVCESVFLDTGADCMPFRDELEGQLPPPR
jgi:hypothetical protein